MFNFNILSKNQLVKVAERQAKSIDVLKRRRVQIGTVAMHPPKEEASWYIVHQNSANIIHELGTWLIAWPHEPRFTREAISRLIAREQLPPEATVQVNTQQDALIYHYWAREGHCVFGTLTMVPAGPLLQRGIFNQESRELDDMFVEVPSGIVRKIAPAAAEDADPICNPEHAP